MYYKLCIKYIWYFCKRREFIIVLRKFHPTTETVRIIWTWLRPHLKKTNQFSRLPFRRIRKYLFEWTETKHVDLKTSAFEWESYSKNRFLRQIPSKVLKMSDYWFSPDRFWTGSSKNCIFVSHRMHPLMQSSSPTQTSENYGTSREYFSCQLPTLQALSFFKNGLAM